MARILLIEPDRILANVYRETLESTGHSVYSCAGAQIGVLLADKVKPEIVITELQLVEHSGIEFLYEFRSYSDWGNIPVILLTQIPPSEFNDNYEMLKHELGVVLYLYKPQTNLAQLIGAVDEQLFAKTS